jgi:multiple sugar transport system permease protein
VTDTARRPSFGSGWIGLRFSRIRGGKPRGPRAGEEKWGWLFISPAVAGLILLSAAPILATFAISLTHWDLLTAPDPAGLDNYARLVNDPRFLTAFRNTAFYTIVSVPLGMAISLGLALALNQAIAGISWIRTMYFLPIVTSTIAIGLVWSWIYSPSSGLLNQFLGVFGLPPQRWVADPFWAMPAIIGMSVWQGLPANTIIFLAGLQAIPSGYYDAASVDGAGPWARLR